LIAPAKPAHAEPPAPSLLSRLVPGACLALIVLLALGLRLPGLNAPLQQDEYGPLYAIAQRSAAPGFTAQAASPLVPVSSFAEVRERSVLPYGIETPLPLYHDLLYLLIHVLPVAAWSLRLPSLLAGLGCVWAMYRLGHRCGGAGIALLAALFTAVEPMQIAVSTMARPYALANLVCVLSFLSLLAILEAPALRARAVLGYALALTCLAYLNLVLLLVVAAHAAFVLLVLCRSAGAAEQTPPDLLSRGIAWLAGGLLAGLLLSLQAPYLDAVRAFYQQHESYLRCFGPPRLVFFVLHNSTFLLTALLAAGIFLLAARSRAWALSDPAPEGKGALTLGLTCLLLPQAAAVLAFVVSGQSVCLSRYLSYTALGGSLVVAYLVWQLPSPGWRFGAAAVLVLATVFWDTTVIQRHFKGSYLLTDTSISLRLQALQQMEEEGLWQEGDVLLLRSGLLEGDFLADLSTPPRGHVEGTCAAPLLTLSPMQNPRPFLVLSLSQHGKQVGTSLGGLYQPERFYTQDLAARLRPYRRFWIVSQDWDRQAYLHCLLPWLAGGLGSSLKHTESNGLSLVERLPGPDTGLSTPPAQETPSWP
jgi:hypothetical protein